MEDQHDPRISAYRPQQHVANRWQWVGARGARWRMPIAPGPPPELSKAERELQAPAEARGAARAARLHLFGLFSTGTVIAMCVVLAAVVIMLAWVVIYR